MVKKSCDYSRVRVIAIEVGYTQRRTSIIPRPRREKGLVDFEHFLGLAVLISGVPIRTFPCDRLHNNHVTVPSLCIKPTISRSYVARIRMG